MTPQRPHIYQHINEACQLIRSKSDLKPEVGVVLGSGLGSIADHVEDRVVIPYTEIPHFHGTSVQGHKGQMILGKMKGVPTVFLEGRFHFYEGYPMSEVVFPTRVVCALGVHTMILTNAAGAVNTKYRAGDIMLIEDHINLMGDNPLKGPNIAELGPRFPDLTEAYDLKIRDLVLEKAKGLEIPLQRGVYAGLIGPTYETPAEVRMLRTLGVDAVGMSTVPESIAANHLGVRVLGFSLLTNLAAGLSPTKLSHDEVMETSAQGVGKIQALLEAIFPNLKK